MRGGAHDHLRAGFSICQRFICLLFAVIAMIYFADRLRTDVLRSLNELSKNHHFREQQ